MTAPLLTGNNVTLRAVEDKDKEALANSKRDPEFLRFVGEDISTAPPLTDPIFERIKNSNLHWAIELDRTCIGIALLNSVETIDRRSEFSIAIFNSEHWGKGYGEESTRLVLHHAFSKLSFHRVGVRVLAYNPRAIRCYEKCGFVVEGTQRESAWVNGEWHDDILMGVLSNEYAI